MTPKSLVPSPFAATLVALTVLANPLSYAADPVPAPAPIVRAAKPTPPPRTPESASTPSRSNPVRHAQFLARKAQGEIGLLFLGDSITDAWPRGGEWSWLKFAPYHPADFGISGETTDQVLWRITNGELDGIKPKAVVIMIGTNNFGHFPDEQPEWVAEGIKKIVGTVHEKIPETQVLLLAVFPRGASADNPLRKKVNALDQILAKEDFGPKTRYLDIGKAFLNDKGELTKEIMPDALHPNAHGYDLWYEAMEPTLKEMME